MTSNRAYYFSYYFAYYFAYFAYYFELHILHILHINIFCILYIYMSRKQPWSIVSPSLLPLLLVSPFEGPAVYVPPPTSIATVMGFITGSSWEIGWFFPHFKRYRSCLSQWNKWKASKYGGYWNDIQYLWLFTAHVHDGGLTLINPCCDRKVSKYAKYAKYAVYVWMTWSSWTTVLLQHRDIGTIDSLNRGRSAQCLFLNVFWAGGAACRTKCYPSWDQKRPRISQAGV